MTEHSPAFLGSEGARLSAPHASLTFATVTTPDRPSDSLAATDKAPSLAPPIEAEAALRAPEGIEPPRQITIAFDGGCLGNPGPGGYGAILVNDRTGSEKIVQGRKAATTNNRMELSAAIEGLSALRPGALVSMLGDSQYVIKGITEWLPGWTARGWQTAGKKPVENVELWQALELAVARHQSVTWTWVRGHSGHELNERADRIAKGEASRAQRS